MLPTGEARRTACALKLGGLHGWLWFAKAWAVKAGICDGLTFELSRAEKRRRLE